MAHFWVPHREGHRTDRIGWLRAAVLGANDGIVSTASIVVGVAAANATAANILVAGTAGLVAGAMSMAAGEYVSVSSQADSEKADMERERKELVADPPAELNELTAIYISRGLDKPLARQVAEQMTKHDALAAHVRDELGILDMQAANPIQAAVASAVAFAVGGILPIITVLITPTQYCIPVVGATTLVFLAILGALAGLTGGASATVGAVRVAFWGALAMAATALVGWLFGAKV